MSAVSRQTIVCLATQAWDAHWTPVQQVVLRLGEHTRVIYVEPFHPPLAWLKRSNTLLRVQRKLPNLRHVTPNVLVYRPAFPYLPWQMKVPLSAWLNASLYRLEIRRLLRKLQIVDGWLWAFFAQSLSVLDLPFRRVIYDCADELAGFFKHPAEQRFVGRVDEALCRRADLVFVGTETLLELKQPFNPRTFVVNHAADIAHFRTATDATTVVPDDLLAIPHPRIGFVGMVDDVRFDTEIIRRLADNPNYEVVIIGGLLGDAAKTMVRAPNIHFLGMQPVAKLPGYIKGLDVCLMPYRLNEATRNIYPLKLHEYMATGKPVVTTAIPAVESFRDLMFVADDVEHFVALVARALAESDATLVAARQVRARAHSWEAHVAQKKHLLELYL